MWQWTHSLKSEKIHMAKQKFRLISGLAEFTRETKITAEMRLVANIFWLKYG